MSKRFRPVAVVVALAMFGIVLAACTPPAPPAPTEPYPVQVSASGFSTCATMSDGTVRCWGYPLTGEPFQSERTSVQGTSVPTEVPGLSGIVHVTVGIWFACALDNVGAVYCWGWNERGQLGNGTTVDSATPTRVIALPPATTVEIGVSNACATVSGVGLNAGVYCWGWNNFGQLGNGTKTDTSVPTPVVGVGDAVDVQLGRYHGCALTRNSFVSPPEHRIRCWGDNTAGQLGNGTFTESVTAVPVAGDPGDWIDFSVNNDLPATCGIRDLGTSRLVQCWGASTSGPLALPATVWGLPGEGPVTDVVSSGLFLVIKVTGQNCITEVSGTVRCLGHNTVGELGNGSIGYVSTFDPVFGVTNGVGKVTRGAFHHCVLLKDRNVACWGNDTWGQLGDRRPLTPALLDDVTVENSALTPVLVRF